MRLPKTDARCARRVVALPEEARKQIRAFCDFSGEHWRHVDITHRPECLDKGLGRRNAVVGILANREAVIRRLGVLLAQENDEWLVDRRYSPRATRAGVGGTLTLRTGDYAPHRRKRQRRSLREHGRCTGSEASAHPQHLTGPYHRGHACLTVRPLVTVFMNTERWCSRGRRRPVAECLSHPESGNRHCPRPACCTRAGHSHGPRAQAVCSSVRRRCPAVSVSGRPVARVRASGPVQSPRLGRSGRRRGA
jgi:hypothetical protein